MTRHHPFWLDRFPRSRRPSHPRFRGDATTTVAIVGGGMTGSACAYAFSAAGIPVVVLEADRIGAGATAGGLGLVREDFDGSFQDAARAHGLRAARLLWQGMRRASREFPAALKRLAIKCDLEEQDLLLVASDAQRAALLRREYQARRDAGFDHSWMTSPALAKDTALAAGGAIRTRGFAFDPYRACVGLAAAAVSKGAVFHEHSAVTRVRALGKGVLLKTDGGTLHADAVVIATSAPLTDLRALRRHLHPEHGYAVVTETLPAAVRRELGTRSSALRDSSSPPHFVRWLKEDRVLVAGADQPPVPARGQEQALLQRTGQLMYELSTIYPPISGARPEWSWQYAHDGTADGLPYIGTHRNFPHHLFALGHGRHGAAVAWLAARVLLRRFQGVPDKGDELFGFARVL